MGVAGAAGPESQGWNTLATDPIPSPVILRSDRRERSRRPPIRATDFFSCDIRTTISAMIREFLRSMKTREERSAWMVAMAADALQLAVFPLFVEGALSPADAVLDAVVAVVLVRLLGWHWAFLPTLMIEALPGADLFPTWTAAVFFVTRQSHHQGEPIVLRPEP